MNNSDDEDWEPDTDLRVSGKRANSVPRGRGGGRPSASNKRPFGVSTEADPGSDHDRYISAITCTVHSNDKSGKAKVYIHHVSRGPLLAAIKSFCVNHPSVFTDEHNLQDIRGLVRLLNADLMQI